MTEIELCNRALAVIGHDRQITSLTDGSTEAARCAQFCPAAIRNVLSAYNWDFASAEAIVTLDENPKIYTPPTGFLTLVSIRDADGHALSALRMAGSLQIFGGGSETAIVRYISAETAIAAFPHLVAEAVVYELAALLFGPMVGNVQDSQGTALYHSYTKLAAAKLDAAITAEAAEHAYMGGKRADAGKNDIVNRALAKLGADAVVSDFATDPSPVAARARLFFDPAVREVLRSRDWDFASAEAKVALGGADERGFARLTLPPDLVRLNGVHDEAGGVLECRRNRDFFYVEADCGAAIVRYNAAIEDFSEVPEAFIDLVAEALAVRLAPTVLQDAKDVQTLRQAFLLRLNEESRTEANETAPQGEWQNPLITCRS